MDLRMPVNPCSAMISARSHENRLMSSNRGNAWHCAHRHCHLLQRELFCGVVGRSDRKYRFYLYTPYSVFIHRTQNANETPTNKPRPSTDRNLRSRSITRCQPYRLTRNSPRLRMVFDALTSACSVWPQFVQSTKNRSSNTSRIETILESRTVPKRKEMCERRSP
jgi:hypothetical protein